MVSKWQLDIFNKIQVSKNLNHAIINDYFEIIYIEWLIIIINW